MDSKMNKNAPLVFQFSYSGNGNKIYITQLGTLLKSRGLPDNKGLQKMAFRAQNWEKLCWDGFLFCVLSKGSLNWKAIQQK